MVLMALLALLRNRFGHGHVMQLKPVRSGLLSKRVQRGISISTDIVVCTGLQQPPEGSEDNQPADEPRVAVKKDAKNLGPW